MYCCLFDCVSLPVHLRTSFSLTFHLHRFKKLKFNRAPKFKKETEGIFLKENLFLEETEI